LREEIMRNVSKLPDNRAEMVSLAERYWSIGHRREKRQSPPPSDKKRQRRGHSSDKTFLQGKDRTPTPKLNQEHQRSDGKTLRCYICNSTSHLKPRCPQNP